MLRKKLLVMQDSIDAGVPNLQSTPACLPPCPWPGVSTSTSLASTSKSMTWHVHLLHSPTRPPHSNQFDTSVSSFIVSSMESTSHPLPPNASTSSSATWHVHLVEATCCASMQTKNPKECLRLDDCHFQSMTVHSLFAREWVSHCSSCFLDVVFVLVLHYQ